jgi:hypothetical protein
VLTEARADARTRAERAERHADALTAQLAALNGGGRLG